MMAGFSKRRRALVDQVIAVVFVLWGAPISAQGFQHLLVPDCHPGIDFGDYQRWIEKYAPSGESSDDLCERYLTGPGITFEPIRSKGIANEELPDQVRLTFLAIGERNDVACKGPFCSGLTRCTAFSIGTNALMTSAHCLKQEDGTWNSPVTLYVNRNKDVSGSTCKVTETCVLKSWKGVAGDIGLIRYASGGGCNQDAFLGLADGTTLDIELAARESARNAIIYGYVPQDLAPKYLNPIDDFATDQVRRNNQKIAGWFPDQGAMCHKNSTVGGSSGSVLVMPDESAAYCVHSRSRTDPGPCENVGNPCALIDGETKEAVEVWLSGGTDNRLECRVHK